MAGSDQDSVGVPKQNPFSVTDLIHTAAPALGFVWRVQSITFEYTSDANAGNRQLFIRLVNNNDDTIFERQFGAVQAASLTRRYASFPSAPDEVAFDPLFQIMMPMPEVIITTQGQVRIQDLNTVSALDNIVGAINVVEYGVRAVFGNP